MIEINLLPEELKVKVRTKKTGAAIEPKYFLYAVPLILSILISAHILLVFLTVAKNHQLGVLTLKWKALEPQRRALEDDTMVSQDSAEIQQLMAQRINWSEKLNKLSLYLPSGIWFNDISLSRKDLTIQASVVSLQKKEMSLINKFIDSLKKDTLFFKDFNNLELGSMRIETVGGFNVTDFILTGALKSK
jgi:hypothetical protein